MDGAGHAVLELQVHLGDGVLSEDGSLGDITCKAEFVSCIGSSGISSNWSAVIDLGSCRRFEVSGGFVTYGWQRTRPCCGW